MNNKHKSIEEILEELYVSIKSYTRLNGLKAEDSDAIEQVLAEHRTTLQSYAQQQVKEMLREVEIMRYEEERVRQWISKGGVDYIDNKARLDILEKVISALRYRLKDKTYFY
jgi:phosphoserine phosphatase